MISLDTNKILCYNITVERFYRDVAQLVARLLWEQDAAGSSPVISTKQKRAVWLFFVCLQWKELKQGIRGMIYLFEARSFT